jgi:hypothetical protein
MGLKASQIKSALEKSTKKCARFFESDPDVDEFSCHVGVNLVKESLLDVKPSLEGVTLGIIRKCKKSELKKGEKDKKICLISKTTGRVIGRHRSIKSAKKQELAIKLSKLRKQGRIPPRKK